MPNFDVDRDKFRDWFKENQALFSQKKYDDIYDRFDDRFTANNLGYLTEFLINEARRNPFEYMSTLPPSSLANVNIKSDLVIPASIKPVNLYITGSVFKKLSILCDIKSISIANSSISDLDLMESTVSEIPGKFLSSDNKINIFRISKSVRKIKLYISSNYIKKIVTYPRSKGDKLSIPNADVDWYRSHLYWIKENKSESLTEVYDSSIPRELVKWLGQSARNKESLLFDLKNNFGVEGLALDKLHFVPIDLPLKGNRQRTGPNTVTFIFNDTDGVVRLITTLKHARTSSSGRVNYMKSSWNDLDNFATSAYIVDLSDVSNYMDKQKQDNKKNFKDLKQNKDVYKPAESDRSVFRNYDASGYEIPTVDHLKRRIRDKYPDKYNEVIANINVKKLEKITKVLTDIKDEFSDYLSNPLEDINIKSIQPLSNYFNDLVLAYRNLLDNTAIEYYMEKFNNNVNHIKEILGNSKLFDLASIADEIPYLDESDLGI